MLRKFCYIGLIIFLLKIAVLESALQEIPHSLDKKSICEFMEKIELQRNYETFLVIEQQNVSYCAMDFKQELISCNVKKPKLWHNLEAKLKLKSMFSGQIVAMVCMQEHYTHVGKLSQLLRESKSARILLKLQLKESTSMNLQMQLDQVFVQFYINAMLNVIIILNDFQATKTYYNYQPFPMVTVNQHNFSDNTEEEEYFPQRVQDLYGYPLRTYPDQLQPRTLVYENEKGQIKMLGYVGRLLQTFASKLNGTLAFALQVHIGKPLFFTELMELTLNGTLDIPASIACLNEHAVADLPNLSHYIEIGKWFPMLPVAAELTLSQIYALLLSSDLIVIFLGFYVIFSVLLTIKRYLWSQLSGPGIWLDIFFNEYSLFGAAGGASPTPYYINATFNGKLLVILLFMVGLAINTTFNTYLQTFTMHHPLEQEINSFAEMKRRNMKIFIPPEWHKMLSTFTEPEFVREYGSLFEIAPNLSHFVAHRNSYNRSMAIAETSGIWYVMELQQRYFTRKVFRYSGSVVFNHFIFFALPLPVDSIFKELLNDFILRLHSSGIFKYWYIMSFYDMITLKIISFDDLSTSVGLQAATVLDLYWIWLYYGLSILCCFLVFAVEILYSKVCNVNKK